MTANVTGHEVQSFCDSFHPHSMYAASTPNCAIHGTRPVLTKVTVAVTRISQNSRSHCEASKDESCSALETLPRWNVTLDRPQRASTDRRTRRRVAADAQCQEAVGQAEDGRRKTHTTSVAETNVRRNANPG